MDGELALEAVSVQKPRSSQAGDQARTSSWWQPPRDGRWPRASAAQGLVSGAEAAPLGTCQKGGAQAPPALLSPKFRDGPGPAFEGAPTRVFGC